MAYIDLSKITSRDAQLFISRSPDITAIALDKAEIDTRICARTFGVKTEDIPLTTDNYLQSEMLYIYCEQRFLYRLFDAVKGVVELDDNYTRLAMDAKIDSQLTKDSLSKSIITEEEVIDKAYRATDIEIL